MIFPVIKVRDKLTGREHIVGTDSHDTLYIDKETGGIHYYNLQNGEGTLGDYEFVGVETEYDPDPQIEFATVDQTEAQRLRAALEDIRYQVQQSDHPAGLGILATINQALSTTTEPTGPYTVRRDVAAGINTNGQAFAVAIERNGYTVLHLQPGTERNEEEVEHIVDLLNNRSPEQHLIWEIKSLLETWDFRAIANELESGYEQGVLVELVELCEKLTGAKSPEVGKGGRTNLERNGTES